jgi:hypothetical protein
MMLLLWTRQTGVEWTPEAFDKLELTEVAIYDDEIVGVLARDLERGEVHLEDDGGDGGYYGVEEDAGRDGAPRYQAAWFTDDGKRGVVTGPNRKSRANAYRDAYELYDSESDDAAYILTLPSTRPEVARFLEQQGRKERR